MSRYRHYQILSPMVSDLFDLCMKQDAVEAGPKLDRWVSHLAPVTRARRPATLLSTSRRLNMLLVIDEIGRKSD